MAHQHFSDPEWDGEPLPPEEKAESEQADRAQFAEEQNSQGDPLPKKRVKVIPEVSV